MSKLQTLFVALVLNKHNIQTMHWNNVGLDFDPTHEKLAEYIDEIDTYIDEVAEMLRMVGERPLSLPNCIAFAEKSELRFLVLDEKDYNTSDVWNDCKIIFDQMGAIYDSFSDDDYSKDIISKLQEAQYWFRKENQFKNNSRLQIGTSHVAINPDAAPVAPVESEEDSIVPDTAPSEEEPAPSPIDQPEGKVPLHDDGEEGYSEPEEDDYEEYGDDVEVDDLY